MYLANCFLCQYCEEYERKKGKKMKHFTVYVRVGGRSNLLKESVKLNCFGLLKSKIIRTAQSLREMVC